MKPTPKDDPQIPPPSAVKPWREFESYVVDLYRDLGALELVHDINICGNQIDVFAIVPSYDGSFAKTIISCKHYTGVVGVSAVREWNHVFKALFDARQADSAVIVANEGFTQNAHRLAKDTGIRLTTVDQLRWASCDFTPYLKTRASEFAAEPLFAKKRYISLKLRFDGTRDTIYAGPAIKKFLLEPERTLLILLGDFGAGKTTFTKHLFQTLAADFLRSPRTTRMPIHVNLREYPGHLNLSSLMTDLLVNQYRSRCPGFSAIQGLQREGKLIIIFDAFDEMASRTDYQTTLQNFNALERLLIGTGKIILTCRTHYFKNQEEVSTVYGGTELYKLSQKKRYGIAYVQGFQPHQIAAYVAAVCGDDAPKYIKQIKDTYNLEGLAQRPILLDMITEVLPNLVKEGNAVDSTTLYSVYVDFWLKRDDWRTALSKDERLRFTTAFAVAIYSTKSDVFKWDDVEKAVKTRWPESTKKELEYYQYDIRTCSFIRWEPRTGDYKFVHQSFMEYFVASRLYEGIIHNDRQVLAGRNHSDGVLHFLSEFKGTEQARDTLFIWLRANASDVLVRNVLSVLCKWHRELRKQDFTRIRLSELTLRGFRFSECTFAACLLNTLDFKDNQWENYCRFSDSNIVACSWSDGKWSDVELQRCVISSSVFNATELKDVVLSDCEISEVEFSARGADCRFDVCRLHSCQFQGWTGTGARFFNCSFKHVGWGFEALDGAQFLGGSFVSGATLLAACVHERGSREWSNPPVFRDVIGLDEEVRNCLAAAGAKFPRKTKEEDSQDRVKL